MNFLKKHIITGAPGTGKSTLIEELLKKDIPVIKEASRDIIKQEQLIGGDGLPWDNVLRYAFLVFDEIKKHLKTAPNALFIDRSILDVIAYIEFYGQEPFKEIITFPFHDYFHKTVYVTPLWQDIYVKDLQRPQEFKELKGIEEKLIEVYKRYGFNCVLLPKSKVSDRVEVLMDKLVNSIQLS